jgi:hypothetical protein
VRHVAAVAVVAAVGAQVRRLLVAVAVHVI